ncbi:MAG: hypothetical protein KGI80_00730 [Verrucomicrobiota bacterium]|nr:hypothetical protein [Verrucomicrobiota bacterium]
MKARWRNWFLAVQSSLQRSWSDFLSPPFCHCCLAFREQAFLCRECWQCCELLDSVGRCIHCFEETESPPLCMRCTAAPLLPIPIASLFAPSEPVMLLLRRTEHAPEAIGAYFWLQWDRLGWPLPDRLLPLRGMSRVALAIGDLMERPISPVLTFPWFDAEMLEKGGTFLVIARTKMGVEKAVRNLGEAFPKRVYALILIHGKLDFATFEHR